MSNKLHFYINGTPNGTDGTEINELTFKNIMKYSLGIRGNGSVSVLPVYMRCESGYKARSVVVSLANSTYLGVIRFSTTVYIDYPSDDNAYISNETTACGDVSNKNVMFYIGFYPDSGTDGFPQDTALQDLVQISYVEEQAS